MSFLTLPNPADVKDETFLLPKEGPRLVTS
jgi:hypothetical protein